MPTEPDLGELATEALVATFPLVFDLDQVRRYTTTGIGANPAAPFNCFSHARSLAGPADRFVTINNDTVYSFAQLDMSVGPLRLELPDTTGRYTVFQMISAWTDNFAYVGRRATGSGAQRYWLVPHDWAGVAPDGVTVIPVPTRFATINGRWAVSGDDDLAAVSRLQDQVVLEAVDSSGRAAGLPDVRAGGDEALDFWERFRLWHTDNPLGPSDAPALRRFDVLGIAGDVPVPSLAPDVLDALRRGYADGMTLLQASLRGGQVEEHNGWQLTLHVFDYNVDHLGLGTIDDDRWKIHDPARRALMRAGAALGGLWGNHAYEAAYLAAYVDDTGEQLVGDRTYSLRLSPTPPNDAFWSLTMYDVPDYYLVENEIQRYSIGDRTPGLVYDEDGGVTITMSARRPDKPDVNWLPAPAGPFRPMLRCYIPGEELLDGRYRLSPITRID